MLSLLCYLFMARIWSNETASFAIIHQIVLTVSEHLLLLCKNGIHYNTGCSRGGQTFWLGGHYEFSNVTDGPGQ